MRVLCAVIHSLCGFYSLKFCTVVPDVQKTKELRISGRVII